MDKTVTAHFIAFTTIVFWATTFIATKLLLEDFTPIEILITRFTLGTIALGVAEILMRKKSGTRKPFNWRQELLFAGAGATGITLYYLLENIALTYSTASNVGIIVSIAPLTTAMLAFLFLREEHPGPAFLVGFTTALVGVALVLFNGKVVLKVNPRGDILALMATLAWAIYSILLRKIDTSTYHVVEYTRRIFCYGLLFMVPAALSMGVTLHVDDFTPRNTGLLLFLGFGASALCFVSWNHAVKILGALKTSAYIYLTPLVSCATAALVLNEKITPMAIGGCALILTGLYLSERKTRLPQKKLQVEKP